MKIARFLTLDLRISAAVQGIRFAAIVVSLGMPLFCVANSGARGADGEIHFARDVRPILSNHCWSCHGPDEPGRQANLRLDVRDDAVRGGESGRSALIPENPADSEMMKRILSHDADEQMPPVSTGKPLSSEQIQTLSRWIEQGAPFAAHWAFETPERSTIPDVIHVGWPVNEIDRFILHRLEQENLTPSSEALPHEWLRRVTLDLTGLPPSLEELNQFEAALKIQSQSVVYEAVVDRLLSSDRHAERMTMQWLDAARYADTNGYNNDEIRTMWPWRDWVIGAYRRDLPYDQFLTEQLAGDLLPDATIDQKVATGFCRNHVLTTEGGIIEEEYHVEYVADRVHTMSTVFLALSIQCARCHDHKYDPITQRDYYQLAAFFNNVPDRVVSYDKARMAEPLLKVPTPAQRSELNAITARGEEIERLLSARRTDVSAVAEWEKGLTAEDLDRLGSGSLVGHFSFDEDGTNVPNTVVSGQAAQIEGSAERVSSGSGRALKFDGVNFVRAGDTGDFDHRDQFSTAARIHLTSNDASTVLSKIDESNSYRGYDVIMENAKVAAHFVDRWPDRALKVVTKDAITLNEWHHIVVTYDGTGVASGVNIYVDGRLQTLDVTNNNRLSETLRTEKPFHVGRRQTSASFRGLIDDIRVYASKLELEDVQSLLEDREPDELKRILKTAASERTAEQQQLLTDYFLRHVDPESKTLRAEQSELPGRRAAIEKEIPATMVMAEPETRRPAYILKRGQYDQRGEEVRAEFPHVFASLTGAGSPAATDAPTVSHRTRLDLARWLTNPDHPLTSRVAVNRLWELVFGTGLVETSEDFGIQGAYPSHPELLDWLATELVRNNWSQRAILRQLVLSATYRQSSDVTSELLERDPRNRLLARSPRYRLSAETVRDSALFVSGLLRERIGGPAVKPYQPEGLWEDVSVERRDKYVPDEGDGLYRRSMYTFWKRTCPPPGLSIFDAPDREICVVRRARTNTPLQALVLLNDPTYVEAARLLAWRCLTASRDPRERLDMAFRCAVSRRPSDSERAELLSLIDLAQQKFSADEAAAREFLSVGKTPIDETVPRPELAAWSAAMSVLLNLDETISR